MSSRRIDQDEYICLSHTSSEDVFRTTWSRRINSAWSYVFSRRLLDVLLRRFQEVFKSSCKESLQDIFRTSWRHVQDVFKTSFRFLAKTTWRCLQDVFKIIKKMSWRYLFKLFLLTCLQDVFETYWTRFWGILRRKLTLLRNLWSGYKISKSELFGKTLYEVTSSTNKEIIVKVGYQKRCCCLSK